MVRTSSGSMSISPRRPCNKPRRPHQTGPPGLAHDNPRTPNVHISGPLRFQHHQNSTRRHPERHRKSETVAGKGRKSAKFFAPHPSGPHPSAPTFSRFGPRGPTLRGPTLRGPARNFGPSTLRGPTFSRFGPPPFGPPTLRGPTLRGPTLRGHTLRGHTLGGSSLRGSTLRGPKGCLFFHVFSWSCLFEKQDTKIGQSRFSQSRPPQFWPKSVN